MSYLIYLSAEHFERINKERMDFLKSLPLMNNWPLPSISALFRNIVSVKKTRNQTIFEEGDPVNEIFFIKSGEVEVIIT